MRSLAVLFLLAQCHGSPVAVPTGDWGGRSARLSVQSDGADFETDCAHGRASQALTLDDNGRFDVAGVYVLEHGGPVRPNEPEDSRPARYRGSLAGATLTLEVQPEGGELLGPYTLGLGERPRLLKCR
jgi:hypothetical protein